MTHNPEQKALLGAFLNTAQHNAYLIINDINEKLGKADVKEGSLASAIDNLFNESKAKLQDRLFAAKFFVSHFPFLRIFVTEDADIAQSQIDIIKELLTNFLKRLNEERNAYSHWKTQSIDFCSAVDKSATPKVDLDALRKHFLAWLGEEGTEQRKIANGRYPEIGKNQYKYIQKYQFSYPFWADTNKPQEVFSLWGIVYFTCLFLEKRQANLFLSSIEGLKNTSNENFKAVRAFYTHYCCHLPQPRLESSDILLDILGELGRCPALLYDLLSDKDKAYFQHTIAYKAGYDAEKIEEVAISKRYDDRFPYFVLRYLDDTNALPDIRFQLYVGKLVKKTYKTKMLGESTDRYLFKDIHVFAKLSEYLQEAEWTVNNAPNPQTNPLKEGQITQYSPRYNLSSNQVYLKIGLSKQDENKPNLSPDAIISIHELPNLVLYTLLHPKKSETDKTSPTQIFISRYIRLYRKFMKALQEEKIQPVVLPLDFHKKRLSKKEYKNMRIHQVKTNQPYTDSELAQIEQRRKLLQEKLDADFKGLKWYYLPEHIQKYLLGFQPESYRRRVLFFMDYLKNETKERLYKIKIINKRKAKEQEENEDGKVKMRTLKAGDIAHWLTKDLVFLKKTDSNKKNNGKPNNQQYNHLQELLAYFPSNRYTIERFLNELGFYSGEGKHPFIDKVSPRDFNTLFSFYEKYLGERKKYLISIYEKVDLVSFFTNQVGFQYLKNLDKKEKSKIQQKLQQYLEHFDKAALKKLFEENQIQDLQNIDEWESIEDFFGKYPKEFKKEKILKNEEIHKLYGHLFNFTYQRSNSANPNYQKPNIVHHQQTPVALPAGLFREAIFEALIAKGVDLEKKDNVWHAVNIWRNKDRQEFYSFPRHYKMHRTEDSSQSAFEESDIQKFEKDVLDSREQALKTFKDSIDLWDKDKNELNIQKGKALKKYRDKILDTEKRLRFEEHKDRILWLVTIQLAKSKEFKQKGGVEIHDIEKFSLANLETFLDSYVEMSMKIFTGKENDKADKFLKQKFKRDEHGKIETVAVEVQVKNKRTGQLEWVKREIPIVEGNYEDKEKENSKGKKEIRQEEYTALTIKDYGDFRRFAKDRRLPALLKYFSQDSFAKKPLERALEYLDINRKNVLKKVMEFEKIIHEKKEVDFNKFHGKAEVQYIEHKSYVNFFHEKIQSIKELLGISHDDIISLRNKIIHNEIPYTNFLQSKMEANFTPEQVVSQIIKKTLCIYDKLIEVVKKQTA